MQKVDIVQGSAYDDEGNAIENTIVLSFYGVGDMTVTIEVNGTTTTYYLNSETGNNSVTLSDYGTYSVNVVDSMGTTATGVYSITKSLNTSAIVLIILASIIILAVVIFILIARGKVKTR